MKVTSHTATEKLKGKCKNCNGPHAIYYCEKFLKLSPQERQTVIKKLNLCVNCLKTGHKAENCTLRSCLKCKQKHNTLLHGTSSVHQKPTVHVGSNLELSSQHNESNSSYVFLGTAQAMVEDAEGNMVKCRILLDSGSQVSFITERLRNKLKVTGKQEELNVQGIGETRLKLNGKINIKVKSRTTRYETSIEAYVMKDITSVQPQQFVNTSGWKLPKDIPLADPDFNKPGRIDMLLGAEVYGELLVNGQIKLSDDLPWLQNTTLASTNNRFCGLLNIELDTQLQKLWEQEECAVEPLICASDKRCEEFFMATMTRERDGRFVVNMPIFSEPSLLGDSAKIAYRRFVNMEKKLARNPDLRVQYNEFLNEYLRLGHMKEISYNDIPKLHYFLPHHYVLKPGSSTTKLRVVFDASAKTSSNLSLNDLMVAGPRTQDELFDIILRFRMHKYVFTADITQMYRQILVHEEDRNLQLIMWRENPTQPLRYFQLCTVTYGTKAAPYLATRCLNQLAADEAVRYPTGSRVIKDFYVDDVITGHDNLHEVIKMKQEITAMLQTAGFKLRKWCSNNVQIIKDIPKEDLEVQLRFNEDDTGHIKALGLAWEPHRDYFIYSTSLTDHTKVTKRSVVSDTAQLFDPLGLINPITVMAKIFIQQLWKSKLDWDQELPLELKERWLQFRNEMNHLNKLKIARHVIIEPMVENVQLHAFADASEMAYGAVIYIRSINHKGEIRVKMLCAKSRVAPIKIVTVPRLELCAARLATQLVQRVVKAINIKIDSVTYWSDSQIVLSWIHGDPAL